MAAPPPMMQIVAPVEAVPRSSKGLNPKIVADRTG
jgi:hypothetical protein